MDGDFVVISKYVIDSEAGNKFFFSFVKVMVIKYLIRVFLKFCLFVLFFF